MNGMAAKKRRKQHAARHTEDGLPRDACEWSVEDWRDLWVALQWVTRQIAERHKREMSDGEAKTTSP